MKQSEENVIRSVNFMNGTAMTKTTEKMYSIISYKASKGLFVPQLGRASSHYLIFHQHWNARQLSNRSMLHAGRYLNDKEICYLRTVIVTANVCNKLKA